MSTVHSRWRRYDNTLFPVFHERLEQKWGGGTAPSLDPASATRTIPAPGAQWTNVDTSAAVAVVPVWEQDQTARPFAVFYLPPRGGIRVLRPITPPVEDGVQGAFGWRWGRNLARRARVSARSS